MRKCFQPQGLFICKQTEHNLSEVLLKMNVSKVFLDMQITSELFPPPKKKAPPHFDACPNPGSTYFVPWIVIFG
jgi:hypothetical protein